MHSHIKIPIKPVKKKICRLPSHTIILFFQLKIQLTTLNVNPVWSLSLQYIYYLLYTICNLFGKNHIRT